MNLPTRMMPSDYNQSSITYYWQVNNSDPVRTVSLNVTGLDGETCSDSASYNITLNNDDINLQAEDFYVLENHKKPFNANTKVLSQHTNWHDDKDIFYDPNYPGDLFIDFHKNYLAHFDVYRTTFGYPNISAWNPGEELKSSIQTGHDDRNPTYVPLALPPWFKQHANEDGQEKRIITFVRRFEGQNQYLLTIH